MKIGNNKVFFDYEILDKYTAGMVLLGTEAKTLELGHVSLQGSFVEISKGEAFLVGSHFKALDHAMSNHDPVRKRKLLLNKKEIRKLSEECLIKHLSIVPIGIEKVSGKFKLIIATAKGKRSYDKRKSEKESEQAAEIRRISKGY